MDKTKKEQAEKLQTKLDKLLQTREKKQQAFDKAKKELSEFSKNIESTKLKLFEILQSGSDDTAFSNWAKKKIGENGNHGNDKTENPKTVNHENANFAKSSNAEKPVSQNHNSQPSQNNNHHVSARRPTAEGGICEANVLNTNQNHQQNKGQNHQQQGQQNPNQRQ